MTWASILLILTGIAIGILGLVLVVGLLVTGFLAFAHRGSATPVGLDSTRAAR